MTVWCEGYKDESGINDSERKTPFLPPLQTHTKKRSLNLYLKATLLLDYLHHAPTETKQTKTAHLPVSEWFRKEMSDCS